MDPFEAPPGAPFSDIIARHADRVLTANARDAA